MGIFRFIVDGFAKYGEAHFYGALVEPPAPAKTETATATAPKAQMQRPKTAWNESDALAQMRGADGKI